MVFLKCFSCGDLDRASVALRGVEPGSVLIHPCFHFVSASTRIAHYIRMSLHVVRSKSHHPFFKGLAFGDMVTKIALQKLHITLLWTASTAMTGFLMLIECLTLATCHKRAL